MGEATFSFQVDETLRSDFAAAAEAKQRSGEDLLRDYMREVVQDGREEAADYDAWFKRAVQKGMDEAEAGHLIPSEEVEAEFAAMRAELRRRMNAEQ